MSEEWPFTTIDDIRWTLPDDWEDVTNQTRYSPQTWKHKSGLIVCVRGIDEDRVTLSPPYESPMEAEWLDTKKYPKGSGAAQIRGLIRNTDP